MRKAQVGDCWDPARSDEEGLWAPGRQPESLPVVLEVCAQSPSEENPAGVGNLAFDGRKYDLLPLVALGVPGPMTGTQLRKTPSEVARPSLYIGETDVLGGQMVRTIEI